MAYQRRMEEDDEQFDAIGESAPAPEMVPESANVWMVEEGENLPAGGARWLEGLKRAEPDSGPPMPEMRVVRDEEPEPQLPKPSAQIASADPEFRPEPKRAPEPQAGDEEGGYDWKRMLASLFGGNASVADLDKLRAASKSQKLAAEKQAMEAKYKEREDNRAQGKFELERDILAPAKAKKLGADADKAGSDAASKALAIGSTPASAQARELVAQRFESTAAKYKSSSNEMIRARAADLERAAKNMRGNDSMSGIQAFEAAKLASVDADDIARDAKDKFSQGETSRMNDSKIDEREEKNKIARERISAAREKSLRPREPSERVKAAQVKDQQKLDDEIEKADWAKQALLSVADLKKNVNTGPIAGRVQNALQSVDMSSDDYNKLKGRLSMVSNRIIKELSGSAVTGNEWQRMQDELANIMNDDSNFESKLADMVELTESIKQRAINKYARSNEGAPVQPSNTARRVTNQAPKVVPGERAPPNTPPMVAPTLPKASSLKGNPAARIEEILKANPNHPRAEELKAKLAELRGE